MQWDDLAERYDFSNLRVYCSGRITIGYPPAVDSVDVMPEPAQTLLSEKHLIGRVVGNCGDWSFAILARPDDVVELPDGKSLLIDNHIVSVETKEVIQAPLDWISGTITDEARNRLFLYNSIWVCCFDATGLAWKSAGLFDGDMTTVKVIDGRVICRGPLPWIDDIRSFELQLDVKTGKVMAGDPEAVELYGDD